MDPFSAASFTEDTRYLFKIDVVFTNNAWVYNFHFFTIYFFFFFFFFLFLCIIFILFYCLLCPIIWCYILLPFILISLGSHFSVSDQQTGVRPVRPADCGRLNNIHHLLEYTLVYSSSEILCFIDI